MRRGVGRSGREKGQREGKGGVCAVARVREGTAFDHQIGFAELDLEGLVEEKARRTAKGRGVETMNTPVNISRIPHGFSARQMRKAGGKTIILTHASSYAQCSQLAARLAI